MRDIQKNPWILLDSVAPQGATLFNEPLLPCDRFMTFIKTMEIECSNICLSARNNPGVLQNNPEHAESLFSKSRYTDYYAKMADQGRSDFYVAFTMSLCALGLKQLLISLLFQIIRL